MFPPGRSSPRAQDAFGATEKTGDVGQMMKNVERRDRVKAFRQKLLIDSAGVDHTVDAVNGDALARDGARREIFEKAAARSDLQKTRVLLRGDFVEDPSIDVAVNRKEKRIPSDLCGIVLDLLCRRVGSYPVAFHRPSQSGTARCEAVAGNERPINNVPPFPPGSG